MICVFCCCYFRTPSFRGWAHIVYENLVQTLSKEDNLLVLMLLETLVVIHQPRRSLIVLVLIPMALLVLYSFFKSS